MSVYQLYLGVADLTDLTAPTDWLHRFLIAIASFSAREIVICFKV